MKRSLAWGTAAVVACALVRCVGDSSTPNDGGTDATTPDTGVDAGADAAPPNDAAQDATDASASGHVYAASLNTGTSVGAVVVFDVPLSNASQPTAVLTNGLVSPADVEITTVNGSPQLVVLDPGKQKIFFYDLPVTSTSTPAFGFSATLPAFDGAFDSKGNLWIVGTAGAGARFAPPYGAASTPAQTFTVPNASEGSYAVGVNKLDGLFLGSSASNNTGHVYGQVTPFDGGLAPSLDNTHVDAPTGVALNGSAVFISDGLHGVIDEFQGPMTSAEAPTAVGATALATPTRLVFNNNGNLVVADAVNGLVILGQPSFNTALVTVPSSFGDAAATTFSYRSVAIGP